MKAKVFSGSLLHAKVVIGLPWLTQQKELGLVPMGFLKDEKVKIKMSCRKRGPIHRKGLGNTVTKGTRPKGAVKIWAVTGWKTGEEGRKE